MHGIVQTVFSFDSWIYSHTVIISEVCVTLELFMCNIRKMLHYHSQVEVEQNPF